MKSDKKLKEACQKEGWDITITPQPPNSPDFNVLDLGFFRSIQSLQQQLLAENVDDLIQAVEEAFYSVPIESTNFIFLSLMKALEGSLKVRGGNQYKLAHMKKYKLLRAGQLPVSTI